MKTQAVLRPASAAPEYKYVEIANDLKIKINNGHFNLKEPLPSQSELMNIYGVALATIRQVLNTLQGDGFVESYRGKGTFVKKEKGLDKTWNSEHFVGLAMIDVAKDVEPIPHNCFMDLHTQVHQRNKELLMRWIDGEQTDVICKWAQRVDAVVLYNGVTEKIVCRLLDLGKRVVVVGAMKEGQCPDDASWVIMDPADCVETGLNLLYSSGHRKIKLVAQKGHNFNQIAIEAYENFMRQKGLDPTTPGIYQPQDYKKELAMHGSEVIKELVDSGPDAIFWFGGVGAAYCVSQLCKMGISVPGEISVLAAHNAPPTEILPSNIELVSSLVGKDTMFSVNKMSTVYVDSESAFTKAISIALNGDEKHIYRISVSPRMHFGETVKISRV